MEIKDTYILKREMNPWKPTKIDVKQIKSVQDLNNIKEPESRSERKKRFKRHRFGDPKKTKAKRKEEQKFFKERQGRRDAMFSHCSRCGASSRELSMLGFCKCVLVHSDYLETEIFVEGRLIIRRHLDIENANEFKARFEKIGKKLPGSGKKRAYSRTSDEMKSEFYKSWEWKKLRLTVIKRYGKKCMCCGSDEKIVVDHIKPVSTNWFMRLDFENLQVLCNDCNMGKSNDDFTDFRPIEAMQDLQDEKTEKLVTRLIKKGLM